MMNILQKILLSITFSVISMVIADKNKKVATLAKTLFFLKRILGYSASKAVHGNEMELCHYYGIYQDEKIISSDKDCGINFYRGCNGNWHVNVLTTYSVDEVDGGFWDDLTLFSSQKHSCDGLCGQEVEGGCGRFNKGFFYYQPVDH